MNEIDQQKQNTVVQKYFQILFHVLSMHVD